MTADPARTLTDLVNDPVCSVCEGHETDHTGCANALQHFLAQSQAAVAVERDARRRLLPLVDHALTRYAQAFSTTSGATAVEKAEWFEEARVALRQVREALSAVPAAAEETEGT